MIHYELIPRGNRPGHRLIVLASGRRIKTFAVNKTTTHREELAIAADWFAEHGEEWAAELLRRVPAPPKIRPLPDEDPILNQWRLARWREALLIPDPPERF